MRKFGRAHVVWLVAYAALMAGLVAGLVIVRRRVLAALDTPAARAEWQAWKEQTAREQHQAVPVRRRPVTSDEPPALILLRDRFPVIVVTSLVIGSFLFAFLAFVMQGAFRGERRTP
ncbi:MAG TPA: hypothetical protein VHC22_23875 [Pirellulales bacterium]|nr:hypothetical protein [Pirellulales bacterium]